MVEALRATVLLAGAAAGTAAAVQRHLDSGGPQPWALIAAAGIALVTYGATAVGLVVVYRQWRRGAWS